MERILFIINFDLKNELNKSNTVTTEVRVKSVSFYLFLVRREVNDAFIF